MDDSRVYQLCPRCKNRTLYMKMNGLLGYQCKHCGYFRSYTAADLPFAHVSPTQSSVDTSQSQHTRNQALVYDFDRYDDAARQRQEQEEAKKNAEREFEEHCRQRVIRSRTVLAPLVGRVDAFARSMLLAFYSRLVPYDTQNITTFRYLPSAEPKSFCPGVPHGDFEYAWAVEWCRGHIRVGLMTYRNRFGEFTVLYASKTWSDDAFSRRIDPEILPLLRVLADEVLSRDMTPLVQWARYLKETDSVYPDEPAATAEAVRARQAREEQRRRYEVSDIEFEQMRREDNERNWDSPLHHK